MKTVFVVNELDSSNIGDQAIFSGLEQALTERGNIVLAAGLQSGTWFGSKRPRSFESPRPANANSTLVRWLKKVARRIYLPVWIGRYVIKAWHDSRRVPNDAILIIGGGGILMNNNFHFPFAIFVRTLIGRVCTHPIAFVGISLGGSLNWLCRALIKYSLLKGSHVYVRDGATLRYLREVLQVHSAQLGPDCAFLGAAASRSSEMSPLSSQVKTKPCLAINVMDNSAGLSSQAFQQYQQFIKDLVTQSSHAVRPVFFTTGWPADHAIAIELAAEIERESSGYIKVEVSSIDGIDSLNNILLNADTVVASRLHSAILTIKIGLPPLCLNVSEKNVGFMNSIGLSDLILDFAAPVPNIETLQQLADHKKSTVTEIAKNQQELGKLMLDAVFGN